METRKLCRKMSINSESDLNFALFQYDMDVEIHNTRILSILDQTIKRVKFVNLLSAIAENKVEGLIPDDLKNQLMRIYERYDKLESNIGSESGEELAAWKAEINSKKVDHELSCIMFRLEEVPGIRVLSDSPEIQESPQVQLFVKCLQELRKSVEMHQNEMAAQEKAREKHLRRCHLRNDQAKKEIAQLEKELVEKNSDLNASIIGKNLLVNRHQTKIERIQKATREAIARCVEESNAAIKTEEESSAILLNSLRTELEESKRKYQSLLQEHIAREKEMRTQRSKAENQLAAFMRKCDQDLTEKQAEEEQLQAEYDEEKRKYEEIQKKLDEQEEEYDELMQEKAAYEQELLEQKLFIFILNRSARRIQRAFRAYKLRKMTKKKSKKGKKK